MKPKIYSLSRDELLASVLPDPERGLFIRKRHRGAGKIGAAAGTMQKNGYRLININSHAYTAQRLMWFYVHGEWPSCDIDHVNGNRDDNRICNLRLATRSQNNVNSRKPKNNTSGFKGAYFDARKNRWASEIWVFKKKKFLGYFETAAEAGAAYYAGARKYYGDFARVA